MKFASEEDVVFDAGCFGQQTCLKWKEYCKKEGGEQGNIENTNEPE
jgi:hypothetical protein